MKGLLSFSLLTFFIALLASCGNRQTERKIISPGDKVVALPYKDFITDTAAYDTIDELNSFAEINNMWVVGFKKGIYLVDRLTKKIYKYYKFDIKSHVELFDGQDSVVGFISIDFVTNHSKNKLLVSTSNGITFQVDLIKYEVDWLVKLLHRTGTAWYSDNGNLLAIGTSYANDSNHNYYSSLFLIDAHTGKYTDHFQEYASVKKILFKDGDTRLLVAYDWNYTDTYLWDITKKDKSIAKFEEDQAYLYDITLSGDNEFVTVNTNGISQWDIKSPEKRNLVFPRSNFGSERILSNKISNGYALIAYDNCYFLDKELHIRDSLSFPVAFEDAQYSGNDTVIILRNLMNNNAPPSEEKDGVEGFYTFNLTTKKLSIYLDEKMANDIIKFNRSKR